MPVRAPRQGGGHVFLDRDETQQGMVERLVHHAEATHAQQRHDLELSQPGARREGVDVVRDAGGREAGGSEDMEGVADKGCGSARAAKSNEEAEEAPRHAAADAMMRQAARPTRNKAHPVCQKHHFPYQADPHCARDGAGYH